MSPLAFKSNNSRPMRCTTLPDTAFERTDNFLSNECIHTRFPFQIASSQGANQKSSGFYVFRFRRTRKYGFVIPLSHLREQPLHARDCSREHFLLKKNQKRNNLNCGRIIAGLPKLHQFLLAALRSNNSSHYVYHDHVCLRYLKSEA